MRRIVLVLAAALALSAPAWAMDHSGMNMEHGSMKGHAAHEEVVDGVKATFKVTTMKEAMKEMGMEMPEGVKETHHISVSFVDAKTGKPITDGKVKVKVLGPDKSEQTKDLMAMHGHFGGDFDMAKKGKYGVMSKFQIKDGKTRSAKFWYTVK
ncbi:hypothetical protein L4X63_00070 [Geomonas sp. Red32]|uniref:hypothetical protein n=1 Tax=Geomonas sp. Red32 TaxID=2912856 RepID=UPI00202CE27F|nr:hypothetical protein [Geomonas sp. Red32]MCM0079976.1 hypothetical protein [Geomonas sp. Red32]